jgi:dephospho-CoA kinase
MGAEQDWTPTVRRLEQLMRLKSFPIAFKMLPDKSALQEIPFMRRPAKKATLCQLLNLVRNFDWTVGADEADFLFATCPSIIGLADVPASHQDGTFRSIVWVKTKADGRRFEESIVRLPRGQYEAVALAPLVYNPFDPDIVLIYANPAQMMLLINSLQLESYEVLQSFCVGESSCSDAIARCYVDGKPSLTIPCYGERRYGHAQDDELVMALPAKDVKTALRGMETLYRRGVRYPISFAGAEAEMGPMFPAAYHQFEDIVARVRGDDRRVILGVTGGIASGKSTVSEMLSELGAAHIDFDVLSRKVVEPGQPALEKIVDYFGRQVLDADGALDRKKMSEIVFQDFEKRKKLESFTHPAIYEEFVRQIEAITSENPQAIIQVSVPLLIEVNMQHMFDKILVVYASPEQQVERLSARDGISRDEAANILKAQLPIDEKLSYADYIVRNEGDLAETRRQVGKLWQELQQLQAVGDSDQ